MSFIGSAEVQTCLEAADDPPETLQPAEVAVKKPRPCSRSGLVQATHTASEELVYRTLWRDVCKKREAQTAAVSDVERAMGTAAVGTSAIPIAAVSHRNLATATGRDLRTVQRAVGGLIRKGSIELISAGKSNGPARYRVFSYTEIIKKQQALEFVSGGGPRCDRMMALDCKSRNAAKDDPQGIPEIGTPEWIQDPTVHPEPFPPSVPEPPKEVAGEQ